ncbi:MAG: hypothetical protein AB7W59_00990 [Acidimicrobiia bacterium]
MNRALLAELQHRRCYPSVTILLPTRPGSVLTAEDRDHARRLLEATDLRLSGDVTEDIRTVVVQQLEALIEQRSIQPAAQALALCASPELATAVSLGRPVEARVVVDDTFATRDLVADLNRTAVYRVVTISSRRARLLVGDRQRLVEERNALWPLERAEDQSHAMWTRSVAGLLAFEHTDLSLPTVVAGVERTVGKVRLPDDLPIAGTIAGNHDRTPAAQLHHAAWPLISDWLRTDCDRALARLDEARSARRYAGGLHEVWPLATEGRIELVVVEDGYRVAARVDELQQLHPTEDVEAVDVIDDVVDDLIEHVLLQGGSAVIVPDGSLADHDRIAATVRF